MRTLDSRMEMKFISYSLQSMRAFYSFYVLGFIEEQTRFNVYIGNILLFKRNATFTLFINIFTSI